MRNKYSITFIGELVIDTGGASQTLYSGFVRIFHFFHFFFFILKAVYGGPKFKA